MPSRYTRVGSVAAVGILALSLAGCSTGGMLFGESSSASETTPTPTPTATTIPFESEFTDMGSVHYPTMVAAQLQLDLDMWTEQKTHEWTADSDKLYSIVINVTDLTVPATAAFATKRQVFMSNLSISYVPTMANGDKGSSVPLLTVNPVTATLDPEALRSDQYGLLITSPKGGFQMESNEIGDLADDVTGITLSFAMTITAESAGGSNTYITQPFVTPVEVAIFTEEDAAQAAAESEDGKN